jgi:hypothetical protein
MNIVQKTVLYALLMGLLISPSYLSSITLDEQIPKDIKELIVQQAIIQSNSAQQADQTIANLSRTSRSWHAALHPYTSQQLGCNDMVQTVKIKCTNTITTIINNMMFLSVADYRVTYHKTKPSPDEYAAIIAYIASPMPALDAQFKIIFDLLTDYYINTPTSISCFYDLLKLYQLNRQYPTDPAIAPQTIPQIHAALKTELVTISESLLIQYTQTYAPVDRNRIGDIITFLHNRTLFTCPSINLQMREVLLDWFSSSACVTRFLQRDNYTQEDVTFLNRTINLKKHLRYSPIQSTKAALQNKKDIPMVFVETAVISALMIKSILIGTTLIGLQKTIGTEKMLYTLGKICGSTITDALVITGLGAASLWSVLYGAYKRKSTLHTNISILLAGLTCIKIMHSLGSKCLFITATASPLILGATIVRFLHANRRMEAASVIKRNLQRRHITL